MCKFTVKRWCFTVCRILTVSGVYMSLRANVGMFPLKNQEKNGEDFKILPGGRGTVASAAFSAMGADSILCAKTANDPNGRILSEFFSAANVSLRCSERAKNVKTGYQMIMFENDGTCRTVRFPGANAVMEKDDIEEAYNSFPDAVFLQKEIPDSAIIETCRIAKEKEIPVFYQPCAKRGDLPLTALGELEMLILDSSEVFSYCGAEMGHIDKCLQACIALSSEISAKYYIIRLDDERGTFVYDGKYHAVIEPHTISSTDMGGAFEVFGAAVTYQYMKTKNVRRSVVYGNVAYALSQSRYGDVDSIPTHSEIEDFIRNNGIKL